MAGKRRSPPKPALQSKAERDELTSEFEGDHRALVDAIEAEHARAAVLVGFTRKAYVYTVGMAYDFLSDDIAEGFEGDRDALMQRLLDRVCDQLSVLQSMASSVGVVLEAYEFDPDDPDRPDV